MSPLLIKISKDLKLVRCPRALAPILVALPSMSLNPQLRSVPVRCVDAFRKNGFENGKDARGGSRSRGVPVGGAFYRRGRRNHGGNRPDR